MEALHLISGGDRGGAKTHVLSLLAQWNTRGEALLLCLGDGPLAREARERGIPCRVLSGSFFPALAQVEEACREHRPGLLHCHGSRANLTGALLRPRLACPVVSTVHSDPQLDYQGRPLAALGYGSLNAWALRRMDALLCVSRAMRETLAARGLPRERLYTVYNGIEPERPPAGEERPAWRAARDIPGTALLLGAAARMDRVKDLPTLLRGFAAAAEREKSLFLALAGSGREEKALRRLAEELGIGDRVRFLGWVEDMESFFDALDLFVLSSRSETFPFVLLSAGRAGKAVIAAAAGGVPELIESGRTGLLFPVGDAAALGRAVEALAADGPRREALGAALRARTREYSTAHMAETVRNAYEIIQNKTNR